MVIKRGEKEEFISDRIKRVFYIFLDIIVLVSFSLAIYTTYIKDYTRTILFLSIGTLLLLFFLIKKFLKKEKDKMPRRDKKKSELIYYIAGFLLIFGVSGLIYAFLPYTLIIGAVSVVVGFLLIFILVTLKRSRKRRR